MTKIEAVGERIIVKRCPSDDRTVGGIVIPDAAKQKSVWGDVVSAGKSEDVSAGDRVLFGRHAGTEFVVDGVEYLALRESDVLAVAESA